MSGRVVPFDEEAICDICGERGAFDFVGDLYCGTCVKGLRNHDGTPVAAEPEGEGVGSGAPTGRDGT